METGHFDGILYGLIDHSPVLRAYHNCPYFKSGSVVIILGGENAFFLKCQLINL